MKPVKTKYTAANFVGEGCDDLPAAVLQDSNGNPVIESCWELTPEELEVVKRTGRIFLQVWGGQPPVRLTVHSDAPPNP